MTKKLIISLAKHIINNRDQFSDEAIELIADWIASVNPAFLRGRFIGFINGENGPNGGER